MVDLGEDDEKFESFMTPITSKNTFGYLQWNSQGWRIHWAKRLASCFAERGSDARLTCEWPVCFAHRLILYSLYKKHVR